MTFNPAPWAVDGARTTASLARQQTFIATGGSEGLARTGDLTVTPLDTPGNGVVIGAGGALVLNRYQDPASTINETYVVSNPSAHTLTASEMPASGPAQHYILAVTIGDPEGSQTGHPWMGADDPADGTEQDFVYVRPFLIPVANGATTIAGAKYPYLPLARIERPVNTTTITAAMIKPLAQIAQPKSKTVIGTAASGGANTLNGAGGVANTYENWPVGSVMNVAIPTWATTAKIIGFVEGVRLLKVGTAKLRIKIGTKATTLTNLAETAAQAVGDRLSYNVGGEIDVTSLAGTTQLITFEAAPLNDASKSAFTTDLSTSGLIQVIFEEVSSA